MTTMHGPARSRGAPSRGVPKQPPERPLRVVPASSRRRPRTPFVVLVVALMALGLVGLLLINTTMQRGAFELTELEERAATLHTRQQALQLEVASMSNPDHIATEAARLGMVPNASPAFLRLPDGKVVGRPSPALPGTNLPGLTDTNTEHRNGGEADRDQDRQPDRNRNQDRGNRNQDRGNRNQDRGNRNQDRGNSGGGR